MAIGVLVQNDLAAMPKFIGRVKILVTKKAKTVAVAILGGAVTEERKQLAGRIQSDPAGMAAKIAVSFVSDNAIASNALNAGSDDSDRTDAQLESAINTAWDAGSWDNVF